jgi:hypothetical protein
MFFLEKICLLLANVNTTENLNNVLSIYDLAQKFYNKDAGLLNKSIETDSLIELNNASLKNISHMCEHFEEKTFNTNFETFQKNEIKYQLIKYIYPFLVFFGVLSNLLAIFLLVKIKSIKSKANRNFSSYLIMLAFSDVVLLLFGSLREYRIFFKPF